MSKRAEEKALETYPGERITTCARGNRFYAGPLLRTGFAKGYEQATQDIIVIVKEYLKKGSRCVEKSTEPQIYSFWDGFLNCAENILRELEKKK